METQNLVQSLLSNDTQTAQSGSRPSSFDFETSSKFVKRTYLKRHIKIHIKSFILTLLIWGTIAISFFMESNYVYLVYCGTAAIYFLYFAEFWYSQTRKFLNQKLDTVQSLDIINEIKRNPPTIILSLKCYHHDQDLVYDDNIQRVISHGEEEFVRFKNWEDLTGEIVGVDFKKLTRIYIEYVYDFADDTSKNTYEVQKQSQYQRNLGKDLNIEQKVEFSTEPHPEVLILGPLGAKLPAIANSFCFMVFTLLTLSWFYRMLVDCAMNDRDLKIIKKIYL